MNKKDFIELIEKRIENSKFKMSDTYLNQLVNRNLIKESEKFEFIVQETHVQAELKMILKELEKMN